MSPQTLIAPSILSADFAKLKDEVQAIEAAGADWVHVDVMDGQFVPNITMGPFIVEALNRLTSLPLDVHLMIEHPERYVEAFVKSGADYITVHPEAPGDKFLALDRAVQFGAKRGVALKPATPVSVAKDYVGLVEMVLVMTVNPGFSGQTMIKSALPKYAQARQLFGPQVLLEIDGGVMPENAAEVRAAGAQVIVAATAVFKSSDYRQAMKALRGG
jgi:ribulose-phosphate 3-epimerase